MNSEEAIKQIKEHPNEHWGLTRLSRRHLKRNGEPKTYIRLEALESQQEAFYEAFEGMVARWGRERALDRVIAAMSDANACDAQE